MTTSLATVDVQTLALPASCELLPSNSRFVNRFNLVSGTSGNKYLIAQCKHNASNGKGGWWACSCPSYKFGRKGVKVCKHLRDLGLPGNHEPFFIGTLAVGGRSGSVGAGVLRDSDRAAAVKVPRKAVRKAVKAAPVEAAPVEAAPVAVVVVKALPAGRLVPTNVNMTDGKIVVEFSAEDSAAVFALLAQLAAA